MLHLLFFLKYLSSEVVNAHARIESYLCGFVNKEAVFSKRFVSSLFLFHK